MRACRIRNVFLNVILAILERAPGSTSVANRFPTKTWRNAPVSLRLQPSLVAAHGTTSRLPPAACGEGSEHNGNADKSTTLVWGNVP